MDSIDFTQQIDSAFDSLPQEAKDFLYKGQYKDALNMIAQDFSLTAEQKRSLDFHLTQVVLLLEHHLDLLTLCQSWGFPPEKQTAFLNKVESAVIIPIVAATNYVEEDEEQNETEPTTTINAPSPADVLASLKSRLTTPTAIAPVSRELPPGPVTPPTTPAPAPQVQKSPTIDPYREIPGR